MQKFWAEVWDWTYSIVIALALAMLVHIFLFVPTQVAGESMMPTLHNGQYLVVSKMSHVLRSLPDYGEIVIIDSRVRRERTWGDDLAEPAHNYLGLFSPAHRTNYVWVKRVIGHPGDTLEFYDGRVYRNGTALDEPYLNEPMRYRSDVKVTVPEGHVFVMGDNRNHSSDSRFIGPVPIDHVLGTVVWEL